MSHESEYHLTLLTSRAPGGVAVVSLGGVDRAHLASLLLRSPGGGAFALAGAAVGPKLALLVCDGEPVDEVLVVERAADIEIHLHGSEAVLATLERSAGPFRSAASGPAEALARRALSDAQLALALEQRGLDFEDFARDLASRSDATRAASVRAAVERSRPALALAEPVALVLCGAQNAGKSTLMNRLLLRERALTGGLAGLTRDPVREQTVLDGYPYTLIDTAGEGAAATEVDERALDLGRAQRAGALRLVVVDGSVGPGELESRLAGPGALWIRNKTDLPQVPWPVELAPCVATSSLDDSAAPRLRREVGERLRCLRELPVAGPAGAPVALDSRQYARLQALL